MLDSAGEADGADLLADDSGVCPNDRAANTHIASPHRPPGRHRPADTHQRPERSPLPGWKKIDALQPFLPTRFQGIAETENDVITVDEYSQRLLHGAG